MSEILIVSRKELEKLLTLDNVIPAVEEALKSLAGGQARNFPVVREFVPLADVLRGEAIFGVKSGYIGSISGEGSFGGILGLKAGGYWARNVRRGLPNHQSCIAVLDPNTGRLVALMDGNYITKIRTAAVGAIAAKLFARPGSSEAAVIGPGTQGGAQTLALAHVLPDLKVVTFYGRSQKSMEMFETTVGPRLATSGIVLRRADSAAAAMKSADIVVTATPSFEPVILDSWVRPGIHISAFGADTHGKQELDPLILGRASLFVDDIAQCSELGETQHALREGVIKQEDIKATIGEVLIGTKVGRSSSEEITVFDATGLSIQDLTAAHVAYEAARREGVGMVVEL